MITSIHAAALRAWLEQSIPLMTMSVNAGLERSLDTAQAFARQTRLFVHRSYTLRASMLRSGVHNFSGRVSATAPYAHFVEYGTKPHIIRPRRKKALRFQMAGAIHFAKFVRHPGTKPRPYMLEMRDRAEPVTHRLMGAAVERVVTRG